MVRFFFIVLIVLVLFGACSDRYFSDRATQDNRQNFREKITHLIPAKALSHIADSIDWDEVFWAFPAFNQTNDTIFKIYKKAVDNYSHLNANQRYNFWLAINGINKPFEKLSLVKIAELEQNCKVKVAAAFCLYNKYDTLLININSPQGLYQKLFAQHLNDTSFKSISFANLKKVLSNNEYAGRKNIISLQPKNRNYSGRAIVLNGNGEIVTNNQGKPKTFSQLARSAANYPHFLTNGNTPCGVYSIQGIENSENRFIGPVPTIQTRLPFEVMPGAFFHGQTNSTVWGQGIYKNLLPKNAPQQMFQAFWAGKAGRSEIIIHGSTIDPEFFKKQPFYPHTPSLGCITGLEVWSEKNGKLLKSDQLELVDTYGKAIGEHGYLIVLNITNKNECLTENDILNFVQNEYNIDN